MNTVIVIDPDMFLETTLEDAKSRKRHVTTSKMETAVWYITPGSLHASGEVYLYQSGNCYNLHGIIHAGQWFWSDFIQEIANAPISDIIIPRGIDDDLRQLAARYGHVYFIRVPSIGLGKLSLALGSGFAPMLVPNGEANGKAVPIQQKQKHVSKPYSPK